MTNPDESWFQLQALPARRVVVVLGMHRSGTSLVAGCLQGMGVDFGPRLMPPNPDNPRGYFEHNDVVNLHDRLLLALDRSWDDTTPFPVKFLQGEERLASYRAQMLSILRRDFADSLLWGLKDPRLCRLLPWWESVWPEAGSRPLFVLVCRPPQEVASSLERREGMSPAKAYLLWLRHVLEAERWSRAHERVLVNFHDLRSDEAAALAPIRQKLALPGPTNDTPGVLADPALGRAMTSAASSDLPPWIQEADAAFRLGLSGDEAAMRTRLDTVAHRLHEAEAFLQVSAASEQSDLRAQLAASRKQARWYESEWQKARTKVETLQERSARQKPVAPPQNANLSNKINESNLIKHNLSKKRKTSKVWRHFISIFLGSR